MALILYNHDSCVTSSQIKSAHCVEMSTSQDIYYRKYLIPTTTMLVADIFLVYLVIKEDEVYTLVKVLTTDLSFPTGGNYIQINNQATKYMQLHNRVLFIPTQALNLCFTGIIGSNLANKRALWVKRNDTTKMYDYINITSTNYFATYFNVLEFSNVTFSNGVGSGFTNLTSNHIGMKVDFDGEYVGGIIDVSGVSSLTLDTTYTGTGVSRAFLYTQGSLEFALDIDGVCSSTWEKYLSIPVIDHDIPYKFWVRDYRVVSEDLVVYANNVIRILGTEFIL